MAARLDEFAMNVLRLLSIATMAMSFSAPAAAAEPFLNFNIPEAPLDIALGSFGRVTKEQLLLDASITDGRRSSRVIGRFTPEAALRQMLTGTGLAVRPVDGQGYAIIAPARTGSDNAVRGTDSAHRFDAYSAVIQTALGRALCGQLGTAPGGYRTMARLWIGAGGTVDRAELLTSSGDAGRDALLTERFRGLAIGVPPAGLPQPITLLVTSEGAAADYCAKLGAPNTVFEVQ